MTGGAARLLLGHGFVSSAGADGWLLHPTRTSLRRRFIRGGGKHSGAAPPVPDAVAELFHILNTTYDRNNGVAMLGVLTHGLAPWRGLAALQAAASGGGGGDLLSLFMPLDPTGELRAVGLLRKTLRDIARRAEDAERRLKRRARRRPDTAAAFPHQPGTW
eukprot:gene12382-10906_t